MCKGRGFMDQLELGKLGPFEQSGFDYIYADGVPSWWEEIVVRMKIPSLDQVYQECVRLGAKIHPVIVLCDDGKFYSGKSKMEHLRIDVVNKVYLMCTGGRNRSQGLWNRAVQCIPKKHIEKPHGAIKANDNYFTDRISPINGDAPRLMDLLHNEVIPSERRERFGEGYSIKQFEDEYWRPIINEGGTVVVAGKAIHGALYRLMELAQRDVKDLSKVNIVCISTEDPYGEADGDLRNIKVERYLRAIARIEFKLI